MLNKKENIIIKILTVLELIISFVGVIILTIVFKMVDNNIRYLFVLGAFLLIVNFNRTMNYFEKKPKVNKYCNKKITRKFQEKLSI